MTLSQQLIRFLLTGIVNTVFGYLVYALGIVVLGWPYLWAVILSYAVGVSFSYLTFRAFVFTSGERGWRSYARFIPAYVALLGFNIAALHGLIDRLHWNPLLAQALMVAVCAALSFVLNRVFVFRRGAQ